MQSVTGTQEVFFVNFLSSDSPPQMQMKKAALALALRAFASGFQVTLSHEDTSAALQEAQIVNRDISPVGEAILGDLYGITGRGFPADALIVFRTAAGEMLVVPDLRLDYWLVVPNLPETLNTGRNYVRVEGTGIITAEVPVHIFKTPRKVHRSLFTGSPKRAAYTILFTATNAVLTSAGTFTANTILSNPTRYSDLVIRCLRSLLNDAENVLSRSGQEIRFLSIFNPYQNNLEDALVEEVPPNIIQPRSSRIQSYAVGNLVFPDVVFVAFDPYDAFSRSSAWPSADRSSLGGRPFTYDGASYTHGYEGEAGTIAINSSPTRATPMHEFCHAASEYTNGLIADLYTDAVDSVFTVNKKARSRIGDPIPATFAEYNGTDYSSDDTRDGLGYPMNWVSYHPEQIDTTRPNLMDNYKTIADEENCRLDLLTHEWLIDRLRARFAR
jgi:hypothetical protein